MATVVLVHGVFNHVQGATPEEAALRKAEGCRPKLTKGLVKAGLALEAPEMVMAYYADLLRPELPTQAHAAEDDPRFEDLTLEQRAEAAVWLASAGAPLPQDPQNIGTAPLRQMLGWLVKQRSGRLAQTVQEKTVRLLERIVVVLLREVEAYTAWPDRRRLTRERVAKTIRAEQPTVVVAHSLGSLVVYEMLHDQAFSDLEVELLLTLGSPLGLPGLARRLDPALQAGRGARPTGVRRWVNIADVGDIVATPPRLSEVFPIDEDETTDTGLGFHALGGYLASGLTAAALAPYLD
ncbi:hypothetical protein GR925_01250 [Streptomyces sp. HUCO-GS316]|uniref:hypothetical protein n=1 Tax=Streptomyces sp. HUCO-GS316 TaxID=2692198 RepID=UPI00136B6A7E|nr:hypothetical protein [Streptomyces sp. HUCO-GS316]MXM62110.1 hypothetical protein [Streptomyces sp. HUCO-GS316]